MPLQQLPPPRSPVQVENAQHPRFGGAGVTLHAPAGDNGEPVPGYVVVLFDVDNAEETVSLADLRKL